MKKIRAVAIVIKGDEVLLMFRKKKDKEYVVFPGGAVEERETIGEAIIREIKEETTLDISIERLLYHQIYDNDTEHYFYLCKFLSGEPKLDDESIEKKMSSAENVYEPRWVALETIPRLLLYPLEIRDLLIEDRKSDFQNCPKEMHIKMTELRHAL